MKRRRRDEELEEQEREHERLQQELVASQATPADRVLELQKTAGNRATTAALSRWGLPTLPLAAAPQWPKEPQVIIDGAVIPLEGWSMAEGHDGAAGPDRSSHLNDVNVVTPLGDHSADLMLKATQGAQIKTAVIVIPTKDGKGYTVTLEEVVISSYSVSDRTVSWALSYRKRTFAETPPKAQPRP